MTNLQKYKDDLKALIEKSLLLHGSLILEITDNATEKRKFIKYIEENKLKIINFKIEYEKWYSEALEVIKQILPRRYDDFKRQYRVEKRKEIDHLTYTISDYIIGIQVTKGDGETVVVDRKAALPKFEQQVNILKAAERRFKSSLFDIKQILQADLFDSEIEAARELLKNGYVRAAGAVAGVVLETHLQQVCAKHEITVKAKRPCITDYNEALKKEETIELPTWRGIQQLADLRNLCDHKKTREPKPEEIEELIDGVDKISKTVC